MKRGAFWVAVVASIAALAWCTSAADARPPPREPFIQSKKPLPKFKDYPAGPVFKGKPARPRVVGEYLRYERHSFEGAAADGPTFAGHYTIVILPCGSTCQAPNILNLRTGRIHPLFSISGWNDEHEDFKPVLYKLDSRLIVFLGARYEQHPVGYHYYVMENDKLKYLRTAVVPGGVFDEPMSME
jgi:hypothetical protein